MERDTARARSDEKFVCVIMDMEAVRNCPKASSGEFFYVSKISVYNLTIYDVGTNQAYLFMWNSGDFGKTRGADEIGSSAYHYLRNIVKSGVEEVTIYADTCAGQNRNKHLISVITKLLNEDRDENSNSVIKINIVYYESGHNQSVCDTIHSVLERFHKNVEIYHPEDYKVLARVANKKQPYIVYDLGSEDVPVYDLNLLSKIFKNFTTYLNEENKKARINWLKTKLIELTSGSTEVGFSTTYNSEDCKMIDLARMPNKQKYTRSKYHHLPCNVELTAKKMDNRMSKKVALDLWKLCEKQQIPRKYHPYYKALVDGSSATVGEDTDCSGEEDNIILNV